MTNGLVALMKNVENENEWYLVQKLFRYCQVLCTVYHVIWIYSIIMYYLIIWIYDDMINEQDYSQSQAGQTCPPKIVLLIWGKQL